MFLTADAQPALGTLIKKDEVLGETELTEGMLAKCSD